MNLPIQGFWGKARIDPETKQLEAWLPLVDHCVDVALTFRELTRLPLIRRRLEWAAGASLEEIQLDRLAVIALLHDLGKANLGFQDKIFNPKAPRAGHIREIAPILFDGDLYRQLDSALNAEQIYTWFTSPEAGCSFLIAAWSHHGSPIVFDETKRTGIDSRWWHMDEQGRDPFAAITELIGTARSNSVFPRAFEDGGTPIPDSPKLQHRFAGLVMLADWLGSHQSFFPLDRPINFDHGAAAQRALLAVGLDVVDTRNEFAGHRKDFSRLFGIPEPRPLQAAIAGLDTAAPEHRLLIAEAETGSGKTEAALMRFFDLFAAGEVDSLYFALPTRVAARELYKRVLGYIERNFPDKNRCPPVLLAVPRYAQIDGVPVTQCLPEDKDNLRWYDDEKQRQAERCWAAEHPKRFLAATVAVGTIDQALLSALQTRHAHLRSVCLDRSLLVVDEVHASDPYMRRLLRGLLSHHLDVGGHALLLSATLGASARWEFTATQGKTVVLPSFEAACTAPYPSLTDITGGAHGVTIPDASNSGKHVRVECLPWMKQLEALIPILAGALLASARVLVVLNTVDRAVVLQRVVESCLDIPSSALFRCEDVICPHHGRFAPADRKVLDEAVSARLGKNSPPGPLLLFGTQTLEQSLDIDADLLITDLCPMDVLLQRIGRLARHPRTRPEGYGSPHQCLVLIPETDTLETLLNAKGEVDGTHKRMGLGSVYEDLRVLELTRRLLLERPEIEIPRDNRLLVESVTHPERLATLTGECWDRHRQKVDGATLAKHIAAHYAALNELYTKPFGEFEFHELNDKARTRLGLDTLRLPLDWEVLSPFGQTLTEIIIPGHMAPKSLPADHITAKATLEGVIELTLGDFDYRYTRYGLERWQ